MKKKTVRQAALGLATAAVISTAGVGAASAAGRVEQGTTQSRSICAFSGLNDDPNAAFPEDGRTQSYGQLVRRGLKGEFPGPGVACNPTKGFGEE